MRRFRRYCEWLAQLHAKKSGSDKTDCNRPPAPAFPVWAAQRRSRASNSSCAPRDPRDAFLTHTENSGSFGRKRKCAMGSSACFDTRELSGLCHGRISQVRDNNTLSIDIARAGATTFPLCRQKSRAGFRVRDRPRSARAVSVNGRGKIRG